MNHLCNCTICQWRPSSEHLCQVKDTGYCLSCCPNCSASGQGPRWVVKHLAGALTEWMRHFDTGTQLQLTRECTLLVRRDALLAMNDEALLRHLAQAYEQMVTITRTYVANVVDGGGQLYDRMTTLGYLLPARARPNPVQLARMLTVPRVLARAGDVCRYCGHDANLHQADNCGGCMFGTPGLYGTTLEGRGAEVATTCDCVALGLPHGWILPIWEHAHEAV